MNGIAQRIHSVKRVSLRYPKHALVLLACHSPIHARPWSQHALRSTPTYRADALAPCALGAHACARPSIPVAYTARLLTRLGPGPEHA